jgi:DNA mismatch repair protein MutS
LTASICSQATRHSLVILDEVGRGTSTFDGLALAQAVVEYIYTVLGPRCLFATHYHELTKLEEQLPGIVSYYASSAKTSQGIVFLYTMVRGVADGSFGVEVAKLASLPAPIIARAESILKALTDEAGKQQSYVPAVPAQIAHVGGLDTSRIQLLEEKVRQQERLLLVLQSVDYDNLSPKQALDLLWKLREEK